LFKNLYNIRTVRTTVVSIRTTKQRGSVTIDDLLNTALNTRPISTIDNQSDSYQNYLSVPDVTLKEARIHR